MHSNVDVGMYCKRDTVSRFLDVSHSVIPPKEALLGHKQNTNKQNKKQIASEESAQPLGSSR